MILTVGLKRICDISFYFTFASFLVVVLGGDNLIMVLPIFTIVAFLSAYLSKYSIIRYASLLPLGLLFLVVPLRLVNMLGVIPAVIYTIITLPKPEERVSQFQYVDVFMLYLKILAGLIILSFLVGVAEFLEDGPLLFSLSFLLNAVILMRLVRHDDAVLKRTQLQIMNAISLVGVMIVVFLFSTDTFLTLLQKTIAWIWSSVVIPILQLGLFIFTSILTFIFNILGLSGWFKTAEIPYLMGEGMDLADVENFVGETERLNWPNPLPIIAAVIIGVIFYRIFKALSQKMIPQPSSDGVEEERIMLDGDPPKRKSRFITGNPIRDTYKKLLKKLVKKGYGLPSHFTSDDVESLIRSVTMSDKSTQLRDAYIPVRYGEVRYTKEDVQYFKRLYKEIIKEMED